MCGVCSSVTAQKAGASPVPGTEAIVSEHHTGPRGVSGRLMSTFTHFAQLFSFGCFLSHYQTQKITRCGYYFMPLFCLFPNSENMDLRSRSLPRLRPESLEFTNSLAEDPAALAVSQSAVLTAGYFVLSNENSEHLPSFLGGDTVTI